MIKGDKGKMIGDKRMIAETNAGTITEGIVNKKNTKRVGINLESMKVAARVGSTEEMMISREDARTTKLGSKEENRSTVVVSIGRGSTVFVRSGRSTVQRRRINLYLFVRRATGRSK